MFHMIFRLRNEIKSLQHELSSHKELIAHYDKQISLLEKQISSRGRISHKISLDFSVKSI